MRTEEEIREKKRELQEKLREMDLRATPKYDMRIEREKMRQSVRYLQWVLEEL